MTEKIENTAATRATVEALKFAKGERKTWREIRAHLVESGVKDVEAKRIAKDVMNTINGPKPKKDGGDRKRAKRLPEIPQ